MVDRRTTGEPDAGGHDAGGRDGPAADPARSAQPGINEREVEDIESRASPRTPVIYEVVSRMGEEEMARPAVSLWWSGIAAGLSISFSVPAQALLEMHLPEERWRPLVSRLGYAVGFLMAVLSRQQLFTENTITAVLPVAGRPSREGLHRLARLWGIGSPPTSPARPSRPCSARSARRCRPSCIKRCSTSAAGWRTSAGPSCCSAASRPGS
jgi:hypothetical protein